MPWGVFTVPLLVLLGVVLVGALVVGLFVYTSGSKRTPTPEELDPEAFE